MVRNNYMLVISAILIGLIAVSSACESSTETKIEESFENLKQVTPIPGISVETLEVSSLDNGNSYFWFVSMMES